MKEKGVVILRYNKAWMLLFGCALFLYGCGSSTTDASELYNESKTQTIQATADFSLSEKSAAGQETLVYGVSPAESLQPAEDTVSADRIHYFTFRQDETSYSDNEGGELLLECLTIPDFYSSDSGLDDWVSGVLDNLHTGDIKYGQKLLSYAQTESANLAEDNFYAHSHHVSMGVGRHDDTVISLLHLSSVYSGGDQPNTIQTAYNLDLKEQRVLMLEDVIYESAATSLIDLIKTAIESKFSALGKELLYDNYDRLIEISLQYGNMSPYWYLNEEGLVVFFNQYELGPFASGIIKAQISYEQLSGILRDDYMPKAVLGKAVNAKILDAPEPGEWIYRVTFGEGETVYVSLEGEAHHVQFSEIYMADQTPIGESMLFSINHIDNNTTIEVTGSIIDPDKIYAVEYYDEQGGPNILYIHGSDIYYQLPNLE